MPLDKPIHDETSTVAPLGSAEMTSTTQSEWLTAEEAAKYLKIKTRTLLLWVRQGKVKAFALSGIKRRVWRFRQADLDAAVMAEPVLPSTAPSVLVKGMR